MGVQVNRNGKGVYLTLFLLRLHYSVASFPDCELEIVQNKKTELEFLSSFIVSIIPNIS